MVKEKKKKKKKKKKKEKKAKKEGNMLVIHITTGNPLKKLGEKLRGAL